jgi:hypothetical protein
MTNKEKVIKLLKYIKKDEFSSDDYDFKIPISNALHFPNPRTNEISLLPLHFVRHRWVIYYRINNDKITYYGYDHYGNYRNDIDLIIDNKKVRDVIFNSVMPILSKKAIHIAEEKSKKLLQVRIMKKELNNNDLGWMTGWEDKILKS